MPQALGWLRFINRHNHTTEPMREADGVKTADLLRKGRADSKLIWVAAHA